MSEKLSTLEKHGKKIFEREIDIDVETGNDGEILCQLRKNNFICSNCSKVMKFENVGYVDSSSNPITIYCHDCLSGEI